MVHRQIKKLTEEGLIEKYGAAPIVFYTLRDNAQQSTYKEIPQELIDYIDRHYLYVTPLGEFVEGYEGFVRWITSIKESNRITLLAQEYKNTSEFSRKHFNKYGFVDATQKFKQTFAKCYPKKFFTWTSTVFPSLAKQKSGSWYFMLNRHKKIVL